jgi:L-lactate dehydrogenase
MMGLPGPLRSFDMTGLRVGIVGAGGVGIATAGALILQGLAGEITIYDRTGDRARGEALDYLHALPLLPRTEIRGRSFDEFEPEDVMIVTVGAHVQPGGTRLDVLEQNLEIMDTTAAAMEAGGLPRVLIMVTNPLDVLTEYFTRRWAGKPVNVMGSGTCLDTLRFGERLADACGVHPRTIHAWVIGEHGDSSVFLFSSATVGALPLPEYAAQRGMDLTPAWYARIEQEVRTAAYRVRELRGSPRHGIGLAVSGLVRCIGRENGTIIPVSVRVADDLCASLPCSLGPDGASEPLWPVMNDAERAGWEHTLDVLRKACADLPATQRF